jgi:hypothetical protein
MANSYKNAFFAPTTTAAVSIYTAPTNGRAIIQNLQVTNTSGSKNVDFFILDSSALATYRIAHGVISGPTICNFAKGPVILEENDTLLAQASTTTNVTAVCSILEISRDDQNG